MSSPAVYRDLCLNVLAKVLDEGAPEGIVPLCKDILTALRSEQMPTHAAPVVESVPLPAAVVEPVQLPAIAPVEPSKSDPDIPVLAVTKVAETPPTAPDATAKIRREAASSAAIKPRACKNCGGEFTPPGLGNYRFCPECRDAKNERFGRPGRGGHRQHAGRSARRLARTDTDTKKRPSPVARQRGAKGLDLS